MRKNILFVGFGDIANRCALKMDDCHLTGIARTEKPVGSSVSLLIGDVRDQSVAEVIEGMSFDAVVVTLTPRDRSDSGYYSAYVEALTALVNSLNKCARAPGIVLFASSTGVYGQTSGEWVNENSETQPTNYTGKHLLAAEKLLAQSGLNYVNVRFAGIYGPGRHHLLKLVSAGKGGGEALTNRIHAEDCAGILVYLMRRFFAGDTLDTCYLASDNYPVAARVVRQWLANEMGFSDSHLSFEPAVGLGKIAADNEPAKRVQCGLNKRCSSQRLLDLGYPFIFADYKKGFGDILAEFRLESN